MAQSRKARLQPKPVADFGHPVTEDEIDRPGGQGQAGLRSAPGPPADAAAGPPPAPAPAQDDQVTASRPAPAPTTQASGQPAVAAQPGAWLGAPAAHSPDYAAAAAQVTEPGEAAYKVRTSDMVPLNIKARVEKDQRRGQEASTIIVLAFKRALDDGVLAGLVAEYKARGAMASPFAGPHVPARRRRGTSTTRLQYNPWSYEDEGIKALVQQYDVSRAVLVSLVLAHYYGLSLDIV